MPWTGPQYAARHFHALHGERAAHAARIANAILRSGAPEHVAIATANAWANRHASGGPIRRLAEPDPDWTDRVMRQWQRIPPDRSGRGDFPDAIAEGMSSHDLLNGADPREVIVPRASGGPTKRRTPPETWQSGLPGSWMGSDGQPHLMPSDPNFREFGEDDASADRNRLHPDDMPPQNWAGPPREAWRGGRMRRADGGYTGTDETTTYADPSAGIEPSLATADPAAQQAIQRFSAMPYEGLQEQVLRMGPASRMGQLAQRVLKQKRMMPTQQQQRPGMGLPKPPQPPAQDTSLQPGLGALAGAIKEGFGSPSKPEEPAADTGTVGYAPGGMTSRHPPWTRSGQSMMRMAGAPTAGFLHSSVPGRTDALRGQPAAGSFVLPADVVSGVAGAEGNSLAGAHAIQMALSTGPYGVPLPHGRRGRAQGGPVDKVDVDLAGGELILTPDQVRAVGGGDIERGTKVLNAFVLHVRKELIKTLKKLPGPVKS